MFNDPEATLNALRQQWKSAHSNSERIWEIVRDSNYCPVFDNSWTTWVFGVFFPILKNVFDWGEIEHDDQIIADVYGARRLVDSESDAGKAISKITDAACDKQKKDSYADIDKTIMDVLIGVCHFLGYGQWTLDR